MFSEDLSPDGQRILIEMGTIILARHQRDEERGRPRIRGNGEVMARLEELTEATQWPEVCVITVLRQLEKGHYLFLDNAAYMRERGMDWYGSYLAGRVAAPEEQPP